VGKFLFENLLIRFPAQKLTRKIFARMAKKQNYVGLLLTCVHKSPTTKIKNAGTEGYAQNLRSL
jgi:hypothetical protein